MTTTSATISPDIARRTALQFMCGQRPAGGPYSLVIGDDGRWKTNREYRLFVTLSTYSEDGEESVVWQGRLSGDEIAAQAGLPWPYMEGEETT